MQCAVCSVRLFLHHLHEFIEVQFSVPVDIVLYHQVQHLNTNTRPCIVEAEGADGPKQTRN